MNLFALTAFVSAFLVFLVQPIIGKLILPWFGGTAAVWSTCLVFFQLALLAGYFYSDWLTRHLALRSQAVVHIGLIAVSLLLLPILPDAAWKPQGDEQPTLRILMTMTATVGLPYFLLATTSPLVQSWFARTYPGENPYRLFALSNFASLAALLAYPFLIEPFVSTRQQGILWSAGFGAFGVLISLSLWRTLRIVGSQPAQHITNQTPTVVADESAPTRTDKLIWIVLPALGSSLLLGVSNQLTQNISSIPLLWILPLALYLLTFVFCFSHREELLRRYRRHLSLPLTALALCLMAWALANRKLDFRLLVQIGIFATGLFVTCMYCHSELAARKPSARHLTTFYLMISIGGAVGSILVGIVAPLVLNGYHELGLTLYALAAFSTWLAWHQPRRPWILTNGVICGLVFFASLYTMSEFRDDTLLTTRNFYGTLRVKEREAHKGDGRKRLLVHGAILHGEQYLDEAQRRTPTSYYKPSSGIGLAMLKEDEKLGRGRRVGVIGLGAGTLAVYGAKGDVFRFYEINPAVVTIAQRDFTYLTDTEATVELAIGDARLSLERETPQRFDVLAVDAFSSDSIPVHLLTLEALITYERHMQPNGIIAFHVSNRFLELHPVVEKIGIERGFNVALIADHRADGSVASDWILLCKNPSVLKQPEFVDSTRPIPQQPTWRIWTDDFNNLVQVLR